MRESNDYEGVVKDLLALAYEYVATGEASQLLRIQVFAGKADGPLLVAFADVVAIHMREQRLRYEEARQAFMDCLRVGAKQMTKKGHSKRMVVTKSTIIGSTIGIDQKLA